MNKKRVLEYILKLTGQPKGAKEVGKALDDVNEKAKKQNKGPSFFARLKADADELGKRIPLVGKAMEAFALISKGPLAAVVIGIGAITVAWKFATAATRAFLVEMQKLAGLDARLSQQGVLTKALRKEYTDLANTMQELTGIADDQWIEVIGQLIQYGADPRSVGIDVDVVKNLAALLKGDLSQATKLYTLALQGNFGSLAEVGIMIDQTASRTEKLAQLQRYAAEVGGGILEAQNKSTAGSVRQLGNEIGDTAEAFGRAIDKTGALQLAIQTMRGQLELVRSVLPGVTGQLEGLQNKMPDLRAEFNATTDAAKSLEQDGIKAVGEAASEADKDLSEYIGRLRELARAELEVTNAKLARDLAIVDADEKSGSLTSTAAAEKRFALKQAAEQRTAAVERKALETEIAAIEASFNERQSALDKRIQGLEQIRSERSELLKGVIGPADDKAAAIRAQQSANNAERNAINTRERLPIPGDANPIARLVPDALVNAKGVVAERQRRRADKKRLEELDASDLALNEQAAQFQTPEVQEAKERGQKLNDELTAGLAVLKAETEAFEEQRRLLERRRESLKLQVETLTIVNQLETETATVSRDGERAVEKKAADKKAAEAEQLALSQSIAGRGENFAARARIAQGEGETDRQFGARLLAFDTLKQRFQEEARALQDGGTTQELDTLLASIREFATVVNTNNRDIRTAFGSMRREIDTLRSQVEASRLGN